MPDMDDNLAFAIRLGILGVFTFVTLKWLVREMDPTRSQEKQSAKKAAHRLLRSLGVDENIALDEHEMLIAQHLVPPTSGVDWNEIGGCRDIIRDLMDSVILPIQLSRSTPLVMPPKGVLLYGPPGCGKTLLAKAVARSAGARFVDLQFSTLTDKWYGESQKLAAAVFSLAVKLQPSIIFIDEIDSFLRSRKAFDHEATAMMKAQFLSLWDGFQSDPTCKVVVMGATNRPKDVDPAILRRMPLRFSVNLPDQQDRGSILKVILKSEALDSSVNIETLAANTDGFSGSELHEVCRLAAVNRMKNVIDNYRTQAGYVIPDEVRGLNQEDLNAAVAKYQTMRTLDDWVNGVAALALD